jgi:mevalonate kinase
MADKLNTANNKFHSKLLLFGEYSIIQESMGLSVPYEIFNGKLTCDQNTSTSEEYILSNQQIEGFYNYLFNLHTEGNLGLEINFDLFRQDIDNKLHFESSIPQGFGIGSSGALCAAIYDKYVINKIRIEEISDKQKIIVLKEHLALLESYFHGKSSGIDPLICYLNLPMLIKSKEDIEPVKIALKKDGKGAIFLIDTGSPRKTEPLVKYYMQRMEEVTFREFVDKQLKPFTNNCIQAFIQGDHETLFGYLTQLSEFQFNHFKPMIPRLFKKLWKKGLDTGDYYLKLCGAGGGGFILGFTQNYEATKEHLKDHKLEVVCAI